MLRHLRITLVKSCVAAAILTTLLAGSASTVLAAPSTSHTPTRPQIYPCQFVHYVDKKGGSGTIYDPVSGGGYTVTLYASFGYDNYFSGEYCWTRTHAVIQESGNVYGGTMYMYLSNCTSQVDSVGRSFAGGGGTQNVYGNTVGAGCAIATGYMVASNGYRVPSGSSSINSGRELS